VGRNSGVLLGGACGRRSGSIGYRVPWPWKWHGNWFEKSFHGIWGSYNSSGRAQIPVPSVSVLCSSRQTRSGDPMDMRFHGDFSV